MQPMGWWVQITATAIGQNKSHDIFQPIAVGVCKNKLESNCITKGYIGGGIGTLRKIIVE